LDKRAASVEEAVAGIKDGQTVMISGFGEAGYPTELIHGLIDAGATGLTVINNNAGTGKLGLAALIQAGAVDKVVCTYPRSAGSYVFNETYNAGKIDLELVPQGTLAERIRAGGAGIPAFYTPTAVGTPLAEGKETRMIDGREYVLEHALHADMALVKADKADRFGNLTYRMAARNFGPIMCMAADVSVVQVREVVDAGAIDPEHVVTPGIFVDRIAEIPNPIHEAAVIKAEAEAK